MHFGQRVHPRNFAYAIGARVIASEVAPGLELQAGTRLLRAAGELIGNGLALKYTIENPGATDLAPYSDAVLPEFRHGSAVRSGNNRLAIPNFEATLTASGLSVTQRGRPILSAPADGNAIGQCGPQTIVRWSLEGITAAYAMGERTGRLNRLGRRHDCHTIDVIGVAPSTAHRDDYDPTYVSIPLLILRATDGTHLGLYFDSAERLNVDVGAGEPRVLNVTCPEGPLPIYLLPGPTLRDVTRRFGQLTGRTALPPTWALGYHQCRWGYRSAEEFRELAGLFAKHDLPLSALWFDIDYMDGYRLFTWDAKRFPAPAALTAELNAAGIRTVAIVDPGVKLEPGYPPYDEGASGALFCRAPSGRDYVGDVWPGETVFPDFSLSRTRQWWASRLARFLRESGVDGAWLDMNEPATGASDPDLMLFDEGRIAHARYHNQYGHLMALASREAFRQLDRARPFLLTRSAFAGTQRNAAVWTGDIASSWSHLRMSMATQLNLGLSGMAFNGADIGGFMGHTDGELLGRWTQAAFLSPFCRNHCETSARPQEPWRFDEETLNICRGAIRTRYRLLPYLYQQFFRHWLEGDPVMRPLCYEFTEERFAEIDDQFLVGDALLVAPMLHSRAENPPVLIDGVPKQYRNIVLPPGRWFDLVHGLWIEGGTTRCYAVGATELPVFVRDGTALPYYAGPLMNSRVSWRELELHCFSSQVPARCTYLVDDLVTTAYQKGEYNRIDLELSAPRIDRPAELSMTENGPLPEGKTTFHPVLYPDLPNAPATTPLSYRVGDAAPVEARLTTRRWLNQDIAAFA